MARDPAFGDLAAGRVPRGNQSDAAVALAGIDVDGMVAGDGTYDCPEPTLNGNNPVVDCIDD